MRALALAAVIATPAWAANDEKPQPYTGPGEWTVSNGPATDVCVQSGTPSGICVMKYATSEAVALDLADHQLKGCAEHPERTHCPEIRAYIKQRWGY